jgi:4a-hydroxytetrahydrobiopterin dehydratase
MTETLVTKACSPCRGGILPLTRAEAEKLPAQAPEWGVAGRTHQLRLGRCDGFAAH